MEVSDDDDDLWLLQALAKLLTTSMQAASPSPDPTPRLHGPDDPSIRFFKFIYDSSNSFLFRDHFRMDKQAFDDLYTICKPYISSKIKYNVEVLAVTLDWLGRAVSCRDQESKFRMAYSTIHRYRRVGLYAIIRALSTNLVVPRTVSKSFVEAFPYFDQAVAAIDGVHVPIVVSASDSERFRNRKGWISTNVLIASDWDMNIAFIYPGAEGADHDSMVLAHNQFLSEIPEHHFVIADAGYALQPQVLTPYRGVRYHLKEWAAGSGRPKTAKELYNLRHAKARNVVERVDGCLKRRFKILRVSIECEFVVVKAIIFAYACLHNFIRQKNSRDLASDLRDEDDSESDDEEGDSTWASAVELFPFDFKTASNWRDCMATTMWDKYIAT